MLAIVHVLAVNNRNFVEREPIPQRNLKRQQRSILTLILLNNLALDLNCDLTCEKGPHENS